MKEEREYAPTWAKTAIVWEEEIHCKFSFRVEHQFIKAINPWVYSYHRSVGGYSISHRLRTVHKRKSDFLFKSNSVVFMLGWMVVHYITPRRRLLSKTDLSVCLSVWIYTTVCCWVSYSLCLKNIHLKQSWNHH